MYLVIKWSCSQIFLIGWFRDSGHRMHTRICNVFEINWNIPFPYTNRLVIWCCHKPTVIIDKCYGVYWIQMPIVLLKRYKYNEWWSWSNLTNISRTCIPARDLLIIASSKEQMLSVLIWIEFKTIWNFPICKLGDALTRLSVPQLDKPIVWSRDELFPISWEVQRSDTLGFVLKPCHYLWEPTLLWPEYVLSILLFPYVSQILTLPSIEAERTKWPLVGNNSIVVTPYKMFYWGPWYNWEIPLNVPCRCEWVSLEGNNALVEQLCWDWRLHLVGDEDNYDQDNH